MRGRFVRYSGAIPRVWTHVMLVVAAAAYGLWVFNAGAAFTFWRPDEWAIFDTRGTPAVESLLRAFNGHWSTLLVASHQIMLRTVGLDDYRPWLALITFAHLLCVGLVYSIVARHSSGVIALLAALYLLFFAQGTEDTFWAFQIGFLGAVATGLVALRLAESATWSHGRTAAVTALLIGSLMWSGVGLVMLVFVGTILASGRRFVPIVAAAATYAAWTLGWSSSYLPREGDPLAFAARVLEILGGMVVGSTSPVALWLVFFLAISGVLGIARGWHAHPVTIAALVGIAALYVGVGLRSGFAPEFANPDRYRYPAMAMALIGSAPLAAPVAHRASKLALGILMGIGTISGLTGLAHSATAWEHQSLIFLAQVAVVHAESDPVTDVRFEPHGLPVTVFQRLEAEWGEIRLDDETRRRLDDRVFRAAASAMRDRLRRSSDDEH